MHALSRAKIPQRGWRCLPAAVSLCALALWSLIPAGFSAQQQPPVVGRIEGDDLAVKTATPAGVETDAGPTAVASGSDVTVRSGHALLLLNDGGEISICGPAHFRLLKAGETVTLALDYGRVHPSLDSPDTLTIYTPMIIATPVAIAGSPRDTTLGLNQTGEMCILSTRGATRIEQQLSGQSLLVPQGGVASLAGGEIESLRNDPASCSCEFPRASVERRRPSTPRELSVLRHPVATAPKRTETAPPAAPPAEQPVFTVLMPALSFDASSPVPPPDPSPETILLVREVRLRPSTVYHGHVNPAPVESGPIVAAASPPPAAAASPAGDDRPGPQAGPGIMTRLRNFFRKMKGLGPCAGAGCGG